MLWERRTSRTEGAEISPGAIRAVEQILPHGAVHPSPLEYVKVAVILAAITLVEVAVYYIEALDDLLILILIVLSIAKFALVALWYMHLKFDSRLFSWMFIGGILLAASVFIAAWASLDILAG